MKRIGRRRWLAIVLLMTATGCMVARFGERSICMHPCTLSPADFDRRTSRIAKLIASKSIARQKIQNGYAFCFPSDQETVTAVLDLVRAERECCGSFLTFELDLPAGDAPLWLRLRGQDGAREFLQQILKPA